MKTWAVIHENKVVNRILWSGESNWTYPFAHDELIESNTLQIGMVKVNGVWTTPEIDETPQTPDIQMVVHDLGEALKPYLKATELTAETLYLFSALYPEWVTGEEFKLDADNKVPFIVRSYKAKMYELVQIHTTQSDWTPDITPALWKVFTPAGVISAWVQPLGAHDAYQIGDKVTYVGFTWECTGANNIYAPGVWGWVKI